MTLIKSISGIRGTIGGRPGDTLSPLDIVKFTAAYGQWLCAQPSASKAVVIGRDARLSGPMVSQLVAATLQALGIDVIDLGLSTTPTVEMAVVAHQAGGGIIITASHNPAQWNALKLLNAKGEFISAAEGAAIVASAEAEDFDFVEVKQLGKYTTDEAALEAHIAQILALPLVDVEAIKKANFSIIVDGVNSSGGIAIPQLLKALGVKKIQELYCEPTGHFPHNPEPLPEHLSDIAGEMQRGNYDLGIVVDPDVDRLALVCQDGSLFGEEYTLVAIADYVLQHTPGATVSNLSSTQALRDITEKAGQPYYSAAVGEVNVVAKMKEVEAVIGGEGNGGVIYPALHYGRDALVGVALMLSYMARSNKSAAMLRSQYPKYVIVKNKITLGEEVDLDQLLAQLQEKYKQQPINTIDGLKIHFDTAWIHLRRSNTEPIVRIYAEAESPTPANALINKLMADVKEILDTSNK
ncbi:phosphoglucosamine mutase [Eisenibacter elegans]|uniref:phosphoglucosamine mutase n=1 Tax=Eisenibacter elegans TaxID=997 RepID=UPI00040D5E78|nr:phosphoglucosamine mutase [Eisenibacter elegans]